MQKFIGFARKSTGLLMTAGTGTFAVYQPGTTTPVTVYPADSTATPVSSFTLPVTGKIEFYARNGDLKVVATEGAETVTVDDVTMNAGTLYGTFAARPAAGSADRRYIATDTGQEYYDDGTAWQELPAGGAVSLTGVQTLTNKTIALGSNTLSGTKAQFDAAVSDDNPAYLGTNQSFTKAQGVARVALTDAATVAVDAALSNAFTLTLGGNRTLGQPTNPKDGQSITIKITQDATGSRTLAYHGDWLFPGGTDPVLSTAANAVDVLSGVYFADTAKWHAVLNKAFA